MTWSTLFWTGAEWKAIWHCGLHEWVGPLIEYTNESDPDDN